MLELSVTHDGPPPRGLQFMPAMALCQPLILPCQEDSATGFIKQAFNSLFLMHLSMAKRNVINAQNHVTLKQRRTFKVINLKL